MSYRDALDEYFQRFKQTERTKQLYRTVLHEMGRKYKKHIEQGYTKEETEDKLLYEISNLRGHYPVLNSLPRKNVKGGDTEKTNQYVWIGLFIVASLGLYLFAPIFAFIPQWMMAIAFLNWAKEETEEELKSSRKRLALLLFGLLLFQMAAMMIRYVGSIQSFFEVIAFYIIGFTLYGFAYLVFKNHKRELPKQTMVETVLNGPRIIHNVNVYLFVVFLISSTMMYVGHFLLVFVDLLFSG